MTEPLFRADAYARERRAAVVEAVPGRIVLDSTLFYPQGGGQPGDRGSLVLADGRIVEIANTIYDADRKTIVHVDSGDVAFDRAEIEQRVNDLIATDAEVTTRWITDEELSANPQFVKTMKVKPPTGQGRVRLVEIAGLDLQPCGGTHVKRLSEIGRAEVTGIEKKGKLNRRVRIRLQA